MGSNYISRTFRRFAAGPIVVSVAALTLTACGGNDSDEAGSALDADIAVAEQSGDGALATAGTAAIDEAAVEPPVAGDKLGTSPDADAIDFGVIGRDVIVEMHVLMSSDDIARSVAAVTADASALGGGIASSNVNYGTADDAGATSGHAVLVVKVPPGNLDRLLAGLDVTGSVISINQSAQDVTEQLVDLDVRISNARTSVDNVRQFMDSTTNLNELVTLEAELTRRQTELEQLEAQKRNLSDRVALSTVTIEIVPTAAAPIVEPEEDDTLGDALQAGIDAFLAVAFGLVFVLALLAPFLVIALLAAAVVWFVVRRRVRRPSADEMAVTHVDDDREPASPVG